MKTGALLVIVGLVAGGFVYWGAEWGGDRAPELRTATIKRGDLNPTISATGTLEPEEVIDVGAQVAGKIYSLGPDPEHPSQSIDYGSVVKEGAELAYIDDAVYRALADQAQAALQKSKADLLQAKAALELAEQELERADRLRADQAVAQSEHDQIVSRRKVARATVATIQAQIKQSQAALRLAKSNLNYTVIKSPVQGVIIDRRVNVGQTVVASLNAPSLFLIAKDLSRMQVWVSVNEADIGRMQSGLPVRFTVDAFPKQTFVGKVEQVRLNATMTQNVVTYTVVVVTDNADGKLLPYLTANVQFEVDRRRGVLLVPNVALRWRPRADSGPSGNPEKPSREEAGGMAEKAAPAAKASPELSERGRIWVKDDRGVHPLDVQVGASDGIFTEIGGPNVEEGLEVVIGSQRPRPATDDGGTTNPFTPKMMR